MGLVAPALDGGVHVDAGGEGVFEGLGELAEDGGDVEGGV